MALIDDIFSIQEVDLGSGNTVHFLHIEEINSELASFIDDNIRLITEGNTSTPISQIKKRFVEYLELKRGHTLEMGAVAEFMIHLYLNAKGFKQEFLYFNLESRSIKLGFDGYYSKEGDEWIMESKSGKINPGSVTHSSKIAEAYNDINNKISDRVGNNPWRNAYNHACHIDVNSAEDIIKNLKELTDDFDSQKYQKIENLNIIPTSTIFLNGLWSEMDIEILQEQLEEYFTNKDFKNINVICTNKKSLSLLEDYLRS